VGFGGMFTSDFTNVNLTSEFKDRLETNDQRKPYNPITKIEEYNMDFNKTISGTVFFAYLDLHYVMASLGLGFFRVTPGYESKSSVNSWWVEKSKWEENNDKSGQSLNTFEIELLGKYPVDIGGDITVFPLLGISLKMALSNDLTYDGKEYTYEEWRAGYSGKEDEFKKVSALNTVWFKLGFGMDIPLNRAYTVYLRPMFLYGIGTHNALQKYSLDYENNHYEGIDYGDFYYSSGSHLNSIVNHGLDIRVTLGFIF
jgi:hypothetical protein